MSRAETGPDLEFWYASVAAVLAKAKKKDPADMPEDAWRSLVATTRDGIEINPLYTRRDETAERSAPGVFPFVRGGSRAGLPDNGWHVCARVDARDGDPAETNREILDLLGDGVSSLWLTTGPDGLDRVLADVYLDLAPVVFDSGAEAAGVAHAYLALVDARREAGDGVADRAAVTADLGVAPLTAGRSTEGPGPRSSSPSMAEAVALAREVDAREETVRTFVADGTVFAAEGADDAQQLAYAVAAGIAYVRAMTDAGMPADRALRQVSFRLATSDDQFQSIALLRAGRLMWSRVAEALGAGDAGASPQHAVTGSAMMTRRDPWVNMLRTTLAAFGAGIGGATSVTVLPFDAAIPGGLENTSRGFTERMARNTQLLLLEESHLGHVVDPAGGSWYVESLTDALADTAWGLLQSVEAAGGLAAALDSGEVDRAIAATREARDADVARRSVPVTGVSEFPNLDEPPLDPSRRGGEGYRYGRAFEDLRDRSDRHLEETGLRPSVFLAGLGPRTETTPRITFIRNLLAAGGIEARDSGATTAGDYADAVSSDRVAVLCGADRRYAGEGPDAVRALRDAGVERVYVAGAEKGFPAEGERPDGFLSLGIDAVAALIALLAELDVK